MKRLLMNVRAQFGHVLHSLSRMMVPPWLDRVWLSLILCSFLFLAPLSVLIWYERDPWFGLSQAIAVGWLAWVRLLHPLSSALTGRPDV